MNLENEEYIGNNYHMTTEEEGFVLIIGKDTGKPVTLKIPLLTAYRLKFYLERWLP